MITLAVIQNLPDWSQGFRTRPNIHCSPEAGLISPWARPSHEGTVGQRWREFPAAPAFPVAVARTASWMGETTLLAARPAVKMKSGTRVFEAYGPISELSCPPLRESQRSVAGRGANTRLHLPLAGTAGFGRGGLLSVAACLAGSPGPTAVALALRPPGARALT